MLNKKDGTTTKTMEERDNKDGQNGYYNACTSDLKNTPEYYAHNGSNMDKT